MKDILKKYKGHVVSDEAQKNLNKPLDDDTGFNEGHEEFLKMLIEKLETKEIDPHLPRSLYNKEVYEKLSEDEQDAVDLSAVNIISIVRQLDSLWKLDQKATFQIQNLVDTIFQMKSKFEEKHGDVYII